MSKEKQYDKIRLLEYILATGTKKDIQNLSKVLTKFNFTIASVLDEIQIYRKLRNLESW